MEIYLVLQPGSSSIAMAAVLSHRNDCGQGVKFCLGRALSLSHSLPVNEMTNTTEREMDIVSRQGVFPRACKGGITVNSKVSHLSTPRVRVKQSEGLCSVEVL